MLYLLLLASLLTSSSAELTEMKQKQIQGFKELLSNMKGTLATCQLVLFSEMVDFPTADDRCRSFELGGKVRGNLATVNDEEKNADLKVLLGMAYKRSNKKWAADQWVWAGLRKVKNNRGNMKARKYNPADWQWADKSVPKSFEMWDTNQPDQRLNRKGGVKYLQNQMRINHDGLWDDTFPYACDYQGKYIISGNMKTWSDAREACHNAGLDMAKVRSRVEVEEMKIAARYFLGPLNETIPFFSAENWIWLGASDDEVEHDWRWNNGDELGRRWFRRAPWARRQPDNAVKLPGAGSQDFLAFSKDGRFDDSYDSADRRRPFACQCPDT